MDENKTQQLVPVNIMIIAGDADTAPENRIAFAQVVYITPEQLKGEFTVRLNDLINTMNKCAEENAKANAPVDSREKQSS